MPTRATHTGVLFAATLLGCSGPVVAGGGAATGSSDTGVGETGTTGTTGTDSAVPTTTSATTGADTTGGPDGPGEPGGSSSDTGAEPQVPGCGDGQLDPGEECDFGAPHNWDHGACTSHCTRARCGDGWVFTGVEGCDDGDDNAVGYGHCDPVTCQPGPHCGDGELAPEEECDGSEPDGGGEVEGADVPCRPGCTWDGRLAFLSSARFTGDLGGLTGADLKCQVAAQAAGLAGHAGFRAWLSDGQSSPLTRLEFGPEPVVLLSGVRLAADLDEMIALGPGRGITMTELRTSVIEADVWTNTAVTGEVFSAVDHCTGWTSLAGSTRRGLNAVPELPADYWQQWRDEKWWTSVAVTGCFELRHLYCIEGVES